MGISASKHPSKQDGLNSPLSRSISVPTQRSWNEGENVNMASWSKPKSDTLEKKLRNVLGTPGKQSGGPLETKFTFKLRPVLEEESCLELQEQWETVDTLDLSGGPSYGRQTPTAGIFEARNRKLLKKLATFHGRKGFTEDRFGRERPAFMGSSDSSVSPLRSFSSKQVLDRAAGLGLLLSPLATPCPSFASPTRGATFNKSLSSSASFDFRFGHDQFSDFPETLDIPSSPLGGDSPSIPEWLTGTGNLADAITPLVDPSILATFEKALEDSSADSWQSSGVSTSGSENISSCSDADSLEMARASGVNVSNHAARKERSWKGAGDYFHNKGDALGDDGPSIPEWLTGAGNLVDPISPLFDPSILATFEKALENSSDDMWQSSGVSTSSSENISSSSETCSDADSLEMARASGINVSNQAARKETSWKGAGDYIHNKGACLNKKSSSSPLDNIDGEWIKQGSIENYERRCPPGCESKIVLYFTSLRGVRKTFEDCCTLRLILQGFRIHVDERDIWMHSKFRDELTDALGVALSVPQLFVKGRYIGGAKEVKQLHEEGLLGKLFEGLPSEWRNVCDVCGGVRFILCTTCSGSCKMVVQGEKKSRCPDCNENGLIMCPSCDC